MMENSFMELLILHLLITGISFFVIWKCTNKMQAIVESIVIFFLPPVGFCLLMAFHLMDGLFGLSKRRRDADAKNDETLFLNSVQYGNDIIPLRDVFLLDDAKKRRQFFTEAVKQDVISNKGILEMAIRDQDRETSYYAVSMLTSRLEVLEERLFMAKNAYHNASEDNVVPLLRHYIEALKEYLSHRRFFDDMTFQKELGTYIELLDQAIERIPEEKEYYAEIFHQLLTKKDFEGAEMICKKFRRQFPDDEDSYIMYLSLFHKMHDKKALCAEIQKMKASPIKLSSKALQFIRYWDRKDLK